MPGQGLSFYQGRGRTEFKPVLLSWRGDKYTSYTSFLLDSAKSAVGDGLAGVVLGGFAEEHPFVIPITIGTLGALYGALKRAVYGVQRPSLRTSWEFFKEDFFS
ncbi:hypothetical protein FJZ19_05700 [Candidatus Pacearchaeota archaeon]|nr:hypothetical protein [Candidatus Pacearchaeota archaeon]